MNWLVFSIVTYVLLGLSAGLGGAWELAGVTPNLLLILAVFVGVSASRQAVLWGLLILGLLLDLQPGPLTSTQGVVVGPHALGYLLGGYATLQLRNMVFRESLLTMVMMVFAIGGFAALVEALLYAFRGLPALANEPASIGATALLWWRLKEMTYTAGVAVPLGYMLHLSRGLWGFASRPRGERVF